MTLDPPAYKNDQTNPSSNNTSSVNILEAHPRSFAIPCGPVFPPPDTNSAHYPPAAPPDTAPESRTAPPDRTAPNAGQSRAPRASSAQPMPTPPHTLL